ncbi:MAG: glycoside hydrolase family 3 protein [Alphaproteobacteria bacterium]
MRKSFIAALLGLTVSMASWAATLEQKVGQMVMVAFNGLQPSDGQISTLLRDLKAGELGGVIISGGNVESPSQLKSLMKPLLNAAKEGERQSGQKVLFSVDQEGGAVARLNDKKGFGKYPRPFDMMEAGDTQAAYNIWKNMACELTDYGINFNLAPVVDLNLVADSPAIGKWGRSFSKHPNKVVKWAELFIDAHRPCGVLTSIKHFPGHGSATGDTHEGFVDVTNTWQPQELEPYKALIAKGKADTIMTAHVVNQKWSNMPATLAPEVIGGILRGQLGYDGVVITDDLMMGAIDQYYSFDERIVQAIKAGADIVLIAAAKDPNIQNAAAARKAIMHAVANGELSEERINQSFERLLRLKGKI